MILLPPPRIRLAFDAIFRKSATLQDVNPGDGSVNNSNGGIPGSTANDIPLTPYVPASPSPFKKVQLVSPLVPANARVRTVTMEPRLMPDQYPTRLTAMASLLLP